VVLGALHRDGTDPGASVVAQLCVRRSPARRVWSEVAGETRTSSASRPLPKGREGAEVSRCGRSDGPERAPVAADFAGNLSREWARVTAPGSGGQSRAEHAFPERSPKRRTC
jgi:hypothetical protein